MKNRMVFVLFICIIIVSISGCGSKVEQTKVPPIVTQTLTDNKEDNSDTDSTGITGEAGNKEAVNKEDSDPVNDSGQNSLGNTAGDQGQKITGDAEIDNSDTMDSDDTDISNVKADDYYIGEVIDSYYEWFSYAVSDSGDEAEYDLRMINDLLYEPGGKLSQKIKEWVDAERTEIKKMIVKSGGYESDIQYTSDTELYVTADVTYEVTKQDNTVETKDIIKTFYLIEVNGKYKIKDIQEVEK